MDEEDEPESRDKKIRIFLEGFLESAFGICIKKMIGLITFISSAMFIFMTQINWAAHEPCCKSWFTNGKAGKLEDMPKFCPDKVTPVNPPCNKYYYSRMPRWFEYMDLGVVLIYLMEYIVITFIA